MVMALDQSIYKRKQKFYKPADYIVSKFGLVGLNKYLAAYLKKTKIRFNLLTPSGVEYKQGKVLEKNIQTKLY